MASRFQSAYIEGTTPWDIGQPQSVVVDLVAGGAITGRVFDAGCGTGENALYLAEHGLDVTGFDFAPAAVERARAKANQRHLTARFEVVDVLDLGEYSGGFDCGIDSGCFHVFDDDARARYVRSLHAILKPSGRMFIMCFSDRVPGTCGPRRVTQGELREAFSDGWRVDAIESAHFDVNPTFAGHDPGTASGLAPIDAWLTRLTRL